MLSWLLWLNLLLWFRRIMTRRLLLLSMALWRLVYWRVLLRFLGGRISRGGPRLGEIRLILPRCAGLFSLRWLCMFRGARLRLRLLRLTVWPVLEP